MLDTQVYEDEFGPVRFIDAENQRWIVARDVMSCMGYSPTSTKYYVSKVANDSDVRRFGIKTPTGVRSVIFINENVFNVLASEKMSDSVREYAARVNRNVFMAEGGAIEADVEDACDIEVVDDAYVADDQINSIMTFSHEMFGEIRTVYIDNKPWFVGKDIAAALGYADTNKAISMHVENENKLNDKTASSLGQRGGWLINESGMYDLILSSKLPQAKEFKRWVTAEVLPSIRKHGGYIAGQEQMSDEQLMAKAYLMAMSKIEEGQRKIDFLTAENEEMRPKALFADAVHGSPTSILVGDIAKILKQNGINIGRGRLYKWFRANKYIMQNGYMPTQYSMNQGLFEIREHVVNMGGATRITQTPLVTGKGQIYFVNKFLKEKAKESNVSETNNAVL